jgi:hypothetical protein
MRTVYAEYTIVGLYSTLAIIGLFGNLWVMTTVLSQLLTCCAPTGPNGYRRRVIGVQSSACIYLLVLSIVDLISFIPVPLLATDIVYSYWPFGTALCKLLYTSEGVNKSLSPLVLAALSVDRYIAVCKPGLFWLRQSRFALGVILFCCSISLLFILPITMNSQVNVMLDMRNLERDKCIVPMDRTYDILHTISCYIIPLFLICSVYLGILCRLYRHTRLSTVGRRTSISLSRVVKCSVLVVAFYFICWTPYWALRIVSIFGK